MGVKNLEIYKLQDSYLNRHLLNCVILTFCQRVTTHSDSPFPYSVKLSMSFYNESKPRMIQTTSTINDSNLKSSSRREFFIKNASEKLYFDFGAVKRFV